MPMTCQDAIIVIVKSLIVDIIERFGKPGLHKVEG
jgi:hypothetical protein